MRNIGDDPVRRFYSSGQGWNMFNSALLTQELREFLQEEIEFVDYVTSRMGRQCSRLVEIGCGYGRYLEWASRRGLSYFGLDLVPWLADMGSLRAQQLQMQFPNWQGHVENASVDQIDQILLAQTQIDITAGRPLVLFPFNCFGNLNRVEAVMQALSRLGADVLISTFKDDEETITIRKAYYQNCGYETNLTHSRISNGVLIQADEGLRAYAYSIRYLKELFERHGFALASPVKNLSRIGVGLLFQPHKARTEESVQTDCSMSVRLMIAQPCPKSSTELLEILEGSARVVELMGHQLSVETTLPCERGAIVRVMTEKDECLGEVLEVVQFSPETVRLSLGLRTISSDLLTLMQNRRRAP